MAHLFLSFASQDATLASSLRERLEKRGRTSWVYVRDQYPADKWWPAIVRAIDEADAVIVVLTESWVRSQVCKDELTQALANHKRVVPVVPEMSDLQAPEALRALHFINLAAPPPAEPVTQILDAVDRDLVLVRLHSRWLGRAQLWEERKDEGRLLRGGELEEVQRYVLSRTSERQAPTPTDLQLRYLEASRSAQKRRTAVLIGSLVAGIVAAAVALFFIWTLYGQAQRDLRLMRVRDLAAQAAAAEGEDRLARASLLALESIGAAEAEGITSPQAEVVLRNVTDKMPRLSSSAPFPGQVDDLQLSPDGRLLLVWSEEARRLSLMELRPTARVIGSVKTVGPPSTSCFTGDRVLTLARSPRNMSQAELVSFPMEGTLPEQVVLPGVSHDPLVAVALSPDCERLATLSMYGRLRTWRGSPAPLRLELQNDAVFKNAGARSNEASLLFSPSGRKLAVAAMDRLAVWYLGPGTAQYTPASDSVLLQEGVASTTGRLGTIEPLGFSKDDRLLVARAIPPLPEEPATIGIGNSSVRGYPLQQLQAWRLPDAEASPENRSARPLGAWAGLLAASSLAITLGDENSPVDVTFERQGRLETWSLPWMEPGVGGTAFVQSVFHPSASSYFHGGYVLERLRLSQDAELAATGDSSGVWVWNPINGREVARIEQLERISAWDARLKEGWLVTAAHPLGQSTTLRLWRLQGTHPLASFGFRSDDVADLAFSPDGARIAAVGDYHEDGTRVRSWRLSPEGEGASPVNPVQEQDLDAHRAAAFLADGGLLVAFDNRVYMAGADAGSSTAEAGIDVGVDGGWIAQLSPGATHVLMHTESGEQVLATLDSLQVGGVVAHTQVTDAWFSPDGKWLLAGDGDGGVSVQLAARLDVAPRILSLAPASRCPPSESMFALSTAPRVLAVGCGRDISLWTLEEESQSVRGRALPGVQLETRVSALGLTPDGRALAIGTDDGLLLLWDAMQGALRARLSGVGKVTQIRFSPDARLLATGHEGGEIALWPLWVSDLRAEACSRLAWNLNQEEWESFMGSEDYRATCTGLSKPDMKRLRQSYGEEPAPASDVEGEHAAK